MIITPIIFCDQDSRIVSEFESLRNNEKQGNYWSSEELAELRRRVKTFYIAAQGQKCCYCDRHLATENHRNWDIEHIVDRSAHAWFLFTPKNLAVACPDCNLAKSDKQVLERPGRKNYPTNSSDFKLVHPHFDMYEEHIFRRGHIYIPRSPKGTFTIYTCNLLRFAERYIMWTNNVIDNRFENEVNAAFQGESHVAQAAVEEIIVKLQQIQ